jgi:uncharacterized membrane protein YfcA
VLDVAVALVAALAAGIASIAGFGIGSLLTPLLAIPLGTKLAVAVVSVPHLIGTAVRFSTLKRHVNRTVLLQFGVLSAIGGLLGALLNARANSPALTIAFGILLISAGLSSLSGLFDRMRLGRVAAWIAGLLSGLFGGLVGNQGGIRSAALLAFDVPKASFVATATAIALIVDGARMPVYFLTQTRPMLEAWPLMLIAAAGVVVGTLWGVRLLRLIPETLFRRGVASLIIILGGYMLVHGIWR